MSIRTVVVTMIVVVGLAQNVPTRAAEVAGKPAVPVVILKLDDITHNGARAKEPIAPRWQRCVDFLKQEQVKASLGIIGFSLEEDHPSYFQWIKDLDEQGSFEFWNHGYRNRKATDAQGEFEGNSLEEQKASLEKTERLAKEKLGLTLKAFGPHWSGTNATTAAALASIPEIKVWFYGPDPTNASHKVVLARTLNLEQPTFVPNFEKFKAGFEKFGRRQPYLALQGHPNQWDDQRFGEFVQIVKYLKAEGCPFQTVSEYVASQAPAAGK
jgi:peptidoglycan/xylan/chitin deacetylase (PgdA/CDA1 family)